MINLKTKSVGRKIALSGCLMAFLAGNFIPLASAHSYISGVQENAETAPFNITRLNSESSWV